MKARVEAGGIFPALLEGLVAAEGSTAGLQAEHHEGESAKGKLAGIGRILAQAGIAEPEGEVSKSAAGVKSGRATLPRLAPATKHRDKAGAPSSREEVRVAQSDTPAPAVHAALQEEPVASKIIPELPVPPTGAGVDEAAEGMPVALDGMQTFGVAAGAVDEGKSLAGNTPAPAKTSTVAAAGARPAEAAAESETASKVRGVAEEALPPGPAASRPKSVTPAKRIVARGEVCVVPEAGPPKETATVSEPSSTPGSRAEAALSPGAPSGTKHEEPGEQHVEPAAEVPRAPESAVVGAAGKQAPLPEKTGTPGALEQRSASRPVRRTERDIKPAAMGQEQGTPPAAAQAIERPDAAEVPPRGAPLEIPAEAPATAPPQQKMQTTQAPPQRRPTRSVVEQILPFRPPVTEAAPTAPVATAPSTGDGENDAAPIDATFDEWLKSPSAGASPRQMPQAEPLAKDAAGQARPVKSVVPETGDAIGDAKVRPVSVAAPDRGEVAFEARLQPVAVHEGPMPLPVAQGVRPGLRPGVLPERAESGVQRTEVRTPVAEVREHPPVERDRKAENVERERTPSAAGPKADAPEAGPVARVPVHGSPMGTPAGSQAALPSSGLREELRVETAAPEAPAPRPEETVKAGGRPETPGASAREIKLEVSGGERRVEVRLSERAGEVRVAVRTPDGRLAGELRENLPELATRFSENGLRSEIWRPAASQAGEWRHTTEPQAGNLSQEGDAQSRGQGGNQGGNPHDDAEQRQARSSQEQKTHKEKGRDFAWLMSSLR